MTAAADRDRGSVTAFVAVISIVLIMVAGMAYDGGQVIATHARARNDARKAARAGAQAVDLENLRATGTIELNPLDAKQAAAAYLDRVHATGNAVIDGPEVTVTVTATQPMRILPGPTRHITVTESATALGAPPP